MSDKARAESAAVIASLDVSHTIVIACNIATNKLWVPDQVIGAYGDIRSGVAKESLRDEWNLLSPSINTIEIWLYANISGKRRDRVP